MSISIIFTYAQTDIDENIGISGRFVLLVSNLRIYIDKHPYLENHWSDWAETSTVHLMQIASNITMCEASHYGSLIIRKSKKDTKQQL